MAQPPGPASARRACSGPCVSRRAPTRRQGVPAALIWCVPTLSPHPQPRVPGARLPRTPASEEGPRLRAGGPGAQTLPPCPQGDMGAAAVSSVGLGSRPDCEQAVRLCWATQAWCLQTCAHLRRLEGGTLAGSPSGTTGTPASIPSFCKRGNRSPVPLGLLGRELRGDREASAPWLRGRLLQSDGGVERMCQAWGLLSFPFRL